MTAPPLSVVTLAALDLGPLSVEAEGIEPLDNSPFSMTLVWEGARAPFVGVFRNARDLRGLQSAVVEARRRAADAALNPVVVVPYLNDDWLSFLRSERMGGMDLSGNGWIQVPGRWSWFQRGFPNRFPEARRARAPFRGRSALVGRVLLSHPRFDTIGDVWEEIQRRDGSLSLSQVSKVLSALEDELIVRKGKDGVKLLQPEKLLDSLAENYLRPDTVQEVNLKADLEPDLFESLMRQATTARARIVGFEPARYAIAPASGKSLLVYVEPRGLSGVSNIPQAERSPRFANLTIRAVRDPLPFFDTEEEDGFKWCSRLETYLQLMQGGKREQETATQFREDILQRARG
jgi:hypothetical protein